MLFFSVPNVPEKYLPISFKHGTKVVIVWEEQDKWYVNTKKDFSSHTN